MKRARNQILENLKIKPDIKKQDTGHARQRLVESTEKTQEYISKNKNNTNNANNNSKKVEEFVNRLRILVGQNEAGNDSDNNNRGIKDIEGIEDIDKKTDGHRHRHHKKFENAKNRRVEI